MPEGSTHGDAPCRKRGANLGDDRIEPCAQIERHDQRIGIAYLSARKRTWCAASRRDQRDPAHNSRRIGVVERDRVPRLHAAHVDRVARAGRGHGRRLVGERPRHAGGEFVELPLRFDEDIVAHFDRGGDLTGADQSVADHVDGDAVCGCRLDRSDAARACVGRIARLRSKARTPVKGQRHGIDAIEQRQPGGRRQAHRAVLPLEGLDVHELRELVDHPVAFVEQPGIGKRPVRHDARVDPGNARKELVCPVDRKADAAFRVRPQRLHAFGDAADLRGKDAGIVEHGGTRGTAARIVDERLQRLCEGVEDAVEGARAAGRTEKSVELAGIARHDGGVGGAGRFQPKLLLRHDIEDALDLARCARLPSGRRQSVAPAT